MSAYILRIITSQLPQLRSHHTTLITSDISTRKTRSNNSLENSVKVSIICVQFVCPFWWDSVSPPSHYYSLLVLGARTKNAEKRSKVTLWTFNVDFIYEIPFHVKFLLIFPLALRLWAEIMFSFFAYQLSYIVWVVWLRWVTWIVHNIDFFNFSLFRLSIIFVFSQFDCEFHPGRTHQQNAEIDIFCDFPDTKFYGWQSSQRRAHHAGRFSRWHRCSRRWVSKDTEHGSAGSKKLLFFARLRKSSTVRSEQKLNVDIKTSRHAQNV